jgi:phage gp29-like protein
MLNTEQVNKNLGVEALSRDAEYLSTYGSGDKHTIDKVMSAQNLSISDLGELEYDNQVSATLQLRKDNVKKLLWAVNKGNEDTAISDFVVRNFERWDIPQLIEHFLSAIAYGYSVSEKYFIPRDGRLYLDSIQPKPPHWFYFDIQNRLRFRAKDNNTGKVLTKDKFVLVQNGATEDNPYGIARLTRCWTPVNFKRSIYQYWLRYVKYFGVPIMVGRTDTTIKGQVDRYQEILDELLEGRRTVLDSEDTIDVVNPNGSNGVLFQSMIEHFDKMISKAILSHASVADTIPGQLGNDDNAIDSVEALMLSDKMMVENAFNKIIKHLVKVNFGDVDENLVPAFEMYEPFTLNLSDTDKTSITLQLQEVEQGLRSKESMLMILSVVYGLEKDQAEALLKPIVQGAVKPAPAPAFSEPENTLSDYAAGILGDTFDPLIKKIAKGTSFSEIEKDIKDFLPDADTEELEKLMLSLMVQADARGQAEVI